MTIGSPARTRRSLAALLLVGLALALPARAAPAAPEAKAFRKLGKAAEKTVKQQLALTAKTARTELKARLAALALGEVDLDAAVAGAVDAVLVAARDGVAGAVVAAEQLAQDGADLLDGVTDPAADFRDGGLGTWDRTVAAMERQLDGLDKKLEAELARFAKGVTVLGKKAGTPRQVRWEFFGHDPRLRALMGPALVATLPAPPPLDESRVRPLVLLQVQVAETGRGTIHRFGGVAFGDVDEVRIDLQFADGEVQTGSSQPVTDDLFSFAVTPDDVTQGPMAFELLSGADVSDRGVLSPPNLVAVPKDVTAILRQFKKDWGSSLRTAGQILSQRTRTLKKDLGSLARQHKLQQISGADALTNAVDAYTSHLLAEGIALEGLSLAPVLNAEDALGEFGLADAAVPAGFLADGGGVHTASLDKLVRKRRAADLARALAFERLVSRLLAQADKAGEPLDASARIRRRADLLGEPLQLEPSAVDSPDRGPTVNLSLLVLAEDGGGPYLDGHVQGTIDPGASNVLLGIQELPGATEALDPMVPGLGGRWGITLVDLDELPVLGRLFDARSENTARSDLVVLSTPGVLVDAP